MPPSLAALLTFGLIALLLAREFKGSGRMDWALWLPTAWIFVVSGRFVSQWLSLGSYAGSPVDEGSPVDAAFFASVTALGVIVLFRRRVSTMAILRNNAWLIALAAYGFLSIVWSDYPFVAGKRFVKTLGHPVMALVILTDPRPSAAIRTVFRRCGCIALPLSVLFIKYFPEYGRAFSPYTGTPWNIGITLNKNELGCLSMLYGIAAYWSLVTRREQGPRMELLLDRGTDALLLGMAAWLLFMSDSATSRASFAVALLIITLLRFGVVSPRRAGIVSILGVTVLAAADAAFDLYGKVIGALGRDPTLTDRTQVWADAIGLVTNPLLGAGFESFWLGSRLQAMAALWWWRPTQAHNGYIETYLNLGLIGLALMIGLLLATYVAILRQLKVDAELGALKLAYLVVVLLFNYTEAAFKGVHVVWTVFHIVAINYPVAATQTSRVMAAGRNVVKRPWRRTRSLGGRRASLPGRRPVRRDAD
jgi:O-antigen ligase